MSANDKPKLSDLRVNIIKRRGDPTKAVTQSGHQVKKEEFVFFKDPDSPGGWGSIETQDYHNEHFLYIDPLFNLEMEVGNETESAAHGRWFAMCTCGSQAVVLAPPEQRKLGLRETPTGPLLVCLFYATQVEHYGVLHAKHQTSFIDKEGKPYK